MMSLCPLTFLKSENDKLMYLKTVIYQTSNLDVSEYPAGLVKTPLAGVHTRASE